MQRQAWFCLPGAASPTGSDREVPLPAPPAVYLAKDFSGDLFAGDALDGYP